MNYLNHRTFGNGMFNDTLPFTGNGFASAKGGSIIPEFAAPKKTFAKIDDGAEMYIVTDIGDEILFAIFERTKDVPNGKFFRLEDLA